MLLGRRAVIFVAMFAFVSSAQAQYRPSIPPMPTMPALPAPTMPLPTLPNWPSSPSLSPIPIPPGAEEISDKYAAETYSRIVGLYKAGNYADALPLAKDLLGVIEKRFGVSNAAYAAAIGIMARLYHSLGYYELAEEYVKQALAIDERVLDAKHPNLATDLGVLGQVYEDQGKFDDAESVMKRALEIEEENKSGPAEIARALNNIAWLYQEQGRFDDAEPLASRSLSLFQEALGEKDADYGRTLDTLAKIWEGQGRLSDAEPQYRRAISVLEQSLGPDHDAVAASLENLGGLLKSQHRLDEAGRLLKRSLEIKQHVFGPESPNVASTNSQLGDLYRQQGKTEEAEGQFQHALAIHKETMREITVFFVTDRVQQMDSKTIAFGDNQSESSIFGRAAVVVTKPAPRTSRLTFISPVPQNNSEVAAEHVETTEMARLAIRKIEIAGDLKSARQRSDAATVFPKQAFVFVHGFNVSFENALRRVAQIAYDLNFDGPPILFSWPSQGGIWNYFKDRDNASVAANHLKTVLEHIVDETGAKKIHLIAHSMGNVVLLEALEKIKLGHHGDSNLGFAEIVLHSPDIAKSRFSQLMGGITGLVSGATLYASQRDRALNLSSWIWGERAGAAPSVVSGVETIDTTAAGSSFFGLNHDLYVTNPVIFNDMRIVLELGKHPPNQRSSEFAPVVTVDGTYWLYRRKTETEKTFVMVSPTTVEGGSTSEQAREAPANDDRALQPDGPHREDGSSMSEDMEKLERELRDARSEAESARRDAGEMRRQLNLERTAKQATEQPKDHSTVTNTKAQQQSDGTPAAREDATGTQPSIEEKEPNSTSRDAGNNGASPATPLQKETVAPPSAVQSASSPPTTTVPETSDLLSPAKQRPTASSSILKDTLPSKSGAAKTQKRDRGRPLSSLHKRRLHDTTSQKTWPYSEWH